MPSLTRCSRLAADFAAVSAAFSGSFGAAGAFSARCARLSSQVCAHSGTAVSLSRVASCA